MNELRSPCSGCGMDRGCVSIVFTCACPDVFACSWLLPPLHGLVMNLLLHNDASGCCDPRWILVQISYALVLPGPTTVGWAPAGPVRPDACDPDPPRSRFSVQGRPHPFRLHRWGQGQGQGQVGGSGSPEFVPVLWSPRTSRPGPE